LKVKPKGPLPASLSARGLGPVALSGGAHGGSSGPPQATEAAWLFAEQRMSVGPSEGRQCDHTSCEPTGIGHDGARDSFIGRRPLIKLSLKKGCVSLYTLRIWTTRRAASKRDSFQSGPSTAPLSTASEPNVRVAERLVASHADPSCGALQAAKLMGRCTTRGVVCFGRAHPAKQLAGLRTDAAISEACVGLM
jgi:hypothetical protein